MAAGYHSNQQHSDGCLSTLQNVVVTFVVVIAMGVQMGGKKMHRERVGGFGQCKYVPGDKEEARE